MAHKDGITSDFIYTEQETRSCINILEPSGQSTEFLEPGQPVLPEEFLAFKAKLVQLTKKPKLLPLMAVFPRAFSAENYKELIEETMAAGVPCIVDASGALLTSCIDALPTMIKPNTDEIGQLLGREVTTEDQVIEAAQELHKRGIKIVVVSLGAKGALMVSDEGTFRANPPKIEAIKSCWCRRYPCWLICCCTCSAKPTSECLTFALSCATASCLSAGTGRFDQDVATKIQKQVTIKKIAE